MARLGFMKPPYCGPNMASGLQKLQVAKAKSGEGVRPSERRRLAEEREREQAGLTGGAYPGPQMASR